MRCCCTCQHFKRPDIDRRLAAGEPLTHLAKEYGLSQSSLYRHRANCLKLGSSNAIKKAAARGSAAAALLPSPESLTGSYIELREHIDSIVRQAEGEGSLRVALAGLSSVRQTLDSLARLAAHETTRATTAAPAHSSFNAQAITERLIRQFDQQPPIKAQLAAALAGMDDELDGSAQPSPPASAGPSEGPCQPGGASSLALPAAVGRAIKTADHDRAAVVAAGGCDDVAADGSSAQTSGGSNSASGRGDTQSKAEAAAIPSDIVVRSPTSVGPVGTGG